MGLKANLRGEQKMTCLLLNRCEEHDSYINGNQITKEVRYSFGEEEDESHRRQLSTGPDH